MDFLPLRQPELCIVIAVFIDYITMLLCSVIQYHLVEDDLLGSRFQA